MRRTALVFLFVLTACAAPGNTGEAPGPTPTVRIVMIATDPATVVLATGQPQLVEFFAFW